MQIGDMVHYVSYGTPGGEYESQCRAAVVTEVIRPRGDIVAGVHASLCVLNPTGNFFNQDLPYAAPERYQGGTWHFREDCDS